MSHEDERIEELEDALDKARDDLRAATARAERYQTALREIVSLYEDRPTQDSEEEAMLMHTTALATLSPDADARAGTDKDAVIAAARHITTLIPWDGVTEDQAIGIVALCNAVAALDGAAGMGDGGGGDKTMSNEPTTVTDERLRDIRQSRDWWCKVALETADRCAQWEERCDALSESLHITRLISREAQKEAAALRLLRANAEEPTDASLPAAPEGEGMGDDLDTLGPHDVEMGID